jgi:ribosome-binding protein aMBF1 (putative translation factor)
MTERNLKMAHRTKGSALDAIERRMSKEKGFREAVEAKLAEIRLEQVIATLRERAGLSQAELARRIKKSQPWIAQAETQSAANMQLSTLATLVAATGGSVHLTVKDRAGKRIQAVELTA